MNEQAPKDQTRLISMHISTKTFIEMKVMCIIMDKSMSEFIRSAIQDKMTHLKKLKDDKNKWE